MNVHGWFTLGVSSTIRFESTPVIRIGGSLVDADLLRGKLKEDVVRLKGRLREVKS